MAETNLGVGVVWALSTGDRAVGTGIQKNTGQTVGRESDSVEHRGTSGDVVGKTYFNQREPLELTVYPSGATIAAAESANILPTPGTVVAIIDTIDTDVGSSSPGRNYVVESSSKVKGLEDKCVMTISLVRYKSGPSNAPVYVPA
jgi:hypothetical protein